LTHLDLAETLQARISTDANVEPIGPTIHKPPDPEKRRRGKALKTQMAALEQALAKAETLAAQRHQEAETAVKRVEALEAHIVTLKEALAKTEAVGGHWRQQAETAAKRVDDLVADLVDISKRMTEQTAAMDKLRVDFDDYRSRSWWWNHATG
jgi:chromosome segregation ATPase